MLIKDIQPPVSKIINQEKFELFHLRLIEI